MGLKGSKWRNKKNMILKYFLAFFFEDEEGKKWIGREPNGDFWKMVVKKNMCRRSRRSFWY
jgi:hypothetical protein